MLDWLVTRFSPFTCTVIVVVTIEILIHIIKAVL